MSISFDGTAKEVILKAEDEVRSFKHYFLGTEHLLLAMLSVEGVASELLALSGTSYETVWTEVDERFGAGTIVKRDAVIARSPNARKVLEFSVQEAHEMGQTLVYPEHFLLAIIRLSELMHTPCMAATILPTCGFGLDHATAKRGVETLQMEQSMKSTGLPGF
jgi:ATP-dependent Clp protease ATP-binding subunit ClpA